MPSALSPSSCCIMVIESPTRVGTHAVGPRYACVMPVLRGCGLCECGSNSRPLKYNSQMAVDVTSSRHDDLMPRCYAQVVKVRGEAMAAASAVGKPHGMLSVIGLTDDDLIAICADARAKLGGDAVCQIANYLFPQVFRYPFAAEPWRLNGHDAVQTSLYSGSGAAYSARLVSQ